MTTRGIIIALCATGALWACGKKDDGKAKQAVPPPPVTDKPAEKPAEKPADKPAEKEVTPGEATASHESYNEALARGRKLVDAGKHADAAEAFRAALAAKPKDAAALSELSWAAFKQGEHDVAIATATESVAGAASDPSLQAASLFNRANAKEAKGDKAGAIADYQQSYTLRPNKVVRARLEKLGAEVPEAVWTATTLKGPFPTVEAYCASAQGCIQGDPSDLTEVDPGKLTWTTKVQTVTTESMSDSNYFDVGLLFETPAGWYALQRFERYINRYGWHVTKVEVVGDIVAIQTENSDGRFETDEDRVVTVCGVGASKQPSCVGPTILAEWFIGYTGTKEDGHNLPPDVAYDCTATLAAADRLEIKASDKGCRAKAGFAGEHKLAFP